jgi:hypothetical protein
MEIELKKDDPPHPPTQADQVPKKKLGRPKKTTSNSAIDTHGIVAVPAVPDDILELVYDSPAMFKKILHLYRQFEVGEIEMSFDGTGMRIVTNDHIGKSTINVTIDGSCMNLYYCKMPLRVCVKRDNFEKVFGCLGKSHYKITFILKEKNYRSIMYVIINDMEYGTEDIYDLDIVFRPEQPAVQSRDCDDEYPVKFTTSAKYFKSRINTIRKLSPVLIIQKAGNSPLQLTFDKVQKINWCGVYNDPEKINLKSTVAPDDIFTVSVTIDYIKPFSDSNIGENVTIAADPRGRISFTTYLDKKGPVKWACLVKIYTEIKDYRRGLPATAPDPQNRELPG